MGFGFPKRKVVRPTILKILPLRRPGSRVDGSYAELSSRPPSLTCASPTATASLGHIRFIIKVGNWKPLEREVCREI